MDPLQFAVLTTHQPRHASDARSALPDAPQIPYATTAKPVRLATAKALVRLADRLAPAPSPAC